MSLVCFNLLGVGMLEYLSDLLYGDLAARRNVQRIDKPLGHSDDVNSRLAALDCRHDVLFRPATRRHDELMPECFLLVLYRPVLSDELVLGKGDAGEGEGDEQTVSSVASNGLASQSISPVE